MKKELLLTGYTLFGIIATLPIIFIGIYVFEKGGFIAAALIYSSSAFSFAIAPRIVAPFSDKTGLRLKYASYGLIIGTLFLFFSIFTQNFPLIFISFLIFASALLQLGQPLFFSYETERSKEIGFPIGKVFMFLNIGYLFGSLIFSFLLSLFGFSFSIIFASTIAILTALLFLKIKEIPVFNLSNSFLNFKAGIDRFLILSSSYILLPAYFFSIVPVYYIFILKGNIISWGFINVIGTILGIIASFYIGKLVDKIGVKKVIIIGTIYYPIYYLVLLFYPNLILFIILYSIPAWLFIWISIFSYSAYISNVYERATALANANLLAGISRTLGGISAGIIAQFLGMENFFIIGIILALVLILLILIVKPK